MLIKKMLKARALGTAAVLLPLSILTGCSSICVDPDPRVCPAGATYTSGAPRVDEIDARGRRAVPLRETPAPPAPVAPVAPRPDPADTIQTAPIQLYDRDAPPDPAPSAPPSQPPAAAAAPAAGTPAAAGARIALLLPMHSPSLGGAADAVRAGFMASYERDGSGLQVELVATGDSPEDTLAAYARAAAGHDVVVGPLARPAVTALAAGGPLAKPTIALNHPEQRGALPPGLLVAGLSLEDEAAQVADWAARAHPQGRALILTGGAAWAQRSATAFEARWSALGRTSQRFAVPSAEGRVEPSTVDTLRDRLEIDPPDLLFAALDVVELRQLASHDGAQACATIPCYGGSSVNPGRGAGASLPELNGLRLVDIPWLVQPDNSAVMVYPRPDESARPLYMSRLYALGIDAFRVAREAALHPGAPIAIDGVTGRLATEGNGESSRLLRRETPAVYRDGNFQPPENGR
jgi:outer membrane PBP1 activator LpoA protein